MADGYLDDGPASPALFDFGLLGAALADVLVQPTDGATVVGLHGPWGSGKTTLAYAIREALRRGEPAREPIFVEFNAWKFESREALSRALILRLVGELGRHGGDAERLEQLEQTLYRAFEVSETGPWSVNWRTAAIEVASVGLEVLQLGFAGRMLRGVLGVKRRGKGDGLSADDVERIGGALERRTVTRHLHRVESIEQFLGAFAEAVEGLRRSGRELVVFVDDLDRCLPDAAIEVFESIKLYLDAPGCSFIVAVDRDMIRKGLAIRYAAGEPVPGRSAIDANEYIEKTIGVSFDVPHLSTEDVGELIASAELPLTLNAGHRELIAVGLGRNPRRVKRFLNLLKVQIALTGRAVDIGRPAPTILLGEGDPGALGALLKTLLIGYRYPALLHLGDDLGALLALQAACVEYKQSSAGAAGVKEGRDAALRDLPPEAAALAYPSEFWRLLEMSPDLDSPTHRDDAIALSNWFRLSGVDGADEAELG